MYFSASALGEVLLSIKTSLLFLQLDLLNYLRIKGIKTNCLYPFYKHRLILFNN